MAKQRFQMYNPELKERYLELREKTLETGTQSIRRLFTKIYEYEKMLGKDVCMFNSYEITNMFYQIDTVSLNVLMNYKSVLTQYVNWCISENLTEDGQNHFEEIDVDSLICYRNTLLRQQMFMDREKLLESINSIQYIYQYMLLAPFEGIFGRSGMELRNLRTTDLDGNTVTLCSGRTFEISDDLVRVIRMAAKETDYKSPGDKTYALIGDEELVLKAKKTKRTINDIMTVGTMNRTFNRACEAAGFPKELSIKRLMFYGMVDYIKTNAAKRNIAAEKLVKEKEFFEYCSWRFGLSLEYYEFYERYLKQFC